MHLTGIWLLIDDQQGIRYRVLGTHIVKMWTTKDVRNEYSTQKCHNVLLRKKRILPAVDL